MRKLLIISLLFLLAGCSADPEQKLNDLFEDGLSYLNNYDFDLARSTFAEITQIDSLSIMAIYGQALTDEREGKLIDAMDRYFVLRQKQPDFYQAHFGLVRLYQLLGFPHEALEMMIEAEKIAPDKYQVGLKLVETYMDVNFDPQAELVIDRLISEGIPTSTLDFVRARLHFRAHQADSASFYLEQALSNPLGQSDYFYYGANCLEEMGLFDSAMTLSEQAWQTATDDRFERMMEHFRRGIKTSYLSEVKKVIREYRDNNANKMSIACIKRVFFELQSDRGKTRRATSDMRMYQPKNLSASYFSAISFVRMIDVMGFSAEMTMLEMKANRGEITRELFDFMLYMTSLAYIESTDNGKAIQKLKNLGEPYTNRREAVLPIVYLNHAGGYFDEADKVAKELEAAHKSDPLWLSGLADIFRHKGIRKFKDAERLYHRSLELDNWNISALEGLVKMYQWQSDFNKAEAAYKQYEYFSNTFPRVAVERAINLIHLDQIDKGLALFNENFPKIRGDVTTFKRMSDLVLKKAPERVEKMFDSLLELRPNDHDALLLAGEFESDRGNYEKGQVLLNQILSDDSEHVLALVEKARADYYLGERESAFRVFEEVLKENLEEADANFYFSHILAEEKIELRKAQNMARRAYFNSDRTLKYWMNLCYTYYQGERFDLCRGEAKKAIKRFKKEAEPFYWHGIALYMEGKPDARENLEIAVNNGLTGVYLDSAQAILSRI